jgi:hypothetical protein
MKGNDAFAGGDFAVAVSLYTHAMAIDPSSGVYALNRCAAHLKLRQYVPSPSCDHKYLTSSQDGKTQKMTLPLLCKCVTDRGKGKRHCSEDVRRSASNISFLQHALVSVPCF